LKLLPRMIEKGICLIKENLQYLEKIVKKKFGKSIKKAGKVVEKKLFNS